MLAFGTSGKAREKKGCLPKTDTNSREQRYETLHKATEKVRGQEYLKHAKVEKC